MQRLKRRLEGGAVALMTWALIGVGGLAVPQGDAQAGVGATGQANFYRFPDCGNLMSEEPASRIYIRTPNEGLLYAVENNFASFFTDEEGLPCYNIVERDFLESRWCMMKRRFASLYYDLPDDVRAACLYELQLVYHRF